MNIFSKIFGKEKGKLPSEEEVVAAINSAEAEELERRPVKKDLDLEIDAAFEKAEVGELERKEAEEMKIKLDAFAEEAVDSYLKRNVIFNKISAAAKLRGDMVKITKDELYNKDSKEWGKIFEDTIKGKLDEINPEAEA